MIADPEVGRPLLAGDLVVGSVVVVGREDRRHMVTVWVAEVSSAHVMFHAGVIRTALIVERREDGTLVDDTGRRLLVFEYLGEVYGAGGGGTIH
jgi:hypothetical protein